MTIQYGTEILTLQPELQVQNGLPSLFYTSLALPVPGSQPRRVNIDTGSVGFVIPQSLLIDPTTDTYYPWAESTSETMTVIYEPSGTTTSGPIVRVSGLSLQSGNTTIPIGPVRVLAHTEGSDSFMMGVGVGLEAKSHYGMADAPQPWTSAATALDNPFLNIVGMSREPGAPFRTAYVMSAATYDGTPGLVTFGQTAQSLDGFHFVPMPADAASPAGFQLPWISVTMTPAGGSSIQTTAQILMDAGIENMFLSVYEPSPPPQGVTATKRPIADWTNAEVRVHATDSAGQTVLDYTFVNGNPGTEPFHNTDPNQIASPSEILNGGPSPQGGSFINTGGHLLALYDYVVDAGNCRMGFRLRS